MADDTAQPQYTFTVYTGTRNRARTLHRPYESLRSQTFRDFEWLVVDNDSDDGTQELIARWQAEADFPIRYIRHANRGHHGSSNVAVREARGDLFVTLDSDDGAVPEALERFKAIWDGIPADQRAGYAGVTALAVDENGAPTGDPYPTDIFDSNATEVYYRYRVLGEKWGFQRTDVMREFPYPTVAGYTGMMSSHLVWGAIGRKYRTRFVNEYLGVVYFDQPDTLTKGVRDLRKNALGERMEAGAVIDDHLRYLRYAPLKYYLKAAKYSRSALWAGEDLAMQVRLLERPAARLLWFAALPLGVGVYAIERLGLARFIPGRDRRGIAR
ncbi:MAG: glycosyltransferase family A protein [Chloroflexota bacterium]